MTEAIHSSETSFYKSRTASHPRRRIFGFGIVHGSCSHSMQNVTSDNSNGYRQTRGGMWRRCEQNSRMRRAAKLPIGLGGIRMMADASPSGVVTRRSPSLSRLNHDVLLVYMQIRPCHRTNTAWNEAKVRKIIAISGCDAGARHFAANCMAQQLLPRMPASPTLADVRY
jgi:hypothetical protein